jgi:hypothetical protein
LKRPPLNLEESQALEDLTVLSRGIGKAKAMVGKEQINLRPVSFPLVEAPHGAASRTW